MKYIGTALATISLIAETMHFNATEQLGDGSGHTFNIKKSPLSKKQRKARAASMRARKARRHQRRIEK